MRRHEMNIDVPPHHAAMDVTSIFLIVLAAIGYMPGIAATLAAAWYIILIYDRLRNGRGQSH